MSITHGYATLAQVKASLRISDNVDDALIELATESASRAIDSFTMRNFYNAGTATRIYQAESPYVVQTDDIAGTAVTVQIDPQLNGTWANTFETSDYQLEPVNGIVDGLQVPYTRIRAVGNYAFPLFNDKALVKVTAVFGWTAVPIEITQACVIQAARFFKRNDSPLGVAGFGDMGAIRVSRFLDPDVEQLVKPFVRYQNWV